MIWANGRKLACITKAQLASAKAQLISAEQNLGFTNVKSPSDGIVNNIPYRLGSLVSPSIATPLTIVSDITEMYVYASLTEKELLELVRKDGSQSAAVETYPEVQLQLSDGSTYESKRKNRDYQRCNQCKHAASASVLLSRTANHHVEKWR